MVRSFAAASLWLCSCLTVAAACGAHRGSEGEAGVALPTSCPGICNAATPMDPVVGATEGRGNVTMYTTEPSNGGACNYGATSVRYFVAANVNVRPGDGHGHWQGGRVCGQCVEVTALTTEGPRAVVVRIMDKCPDASCGMDLGGDAPAAIMLDGYGRYDGAWRFVSCTGHPEVFDGPTALVVMAGSNAWWSRLHVGNPPAAVQSLAWQETTGAGGGTLAYATDPENAFEVPTAALQSASPRLRFVARFTDATSATFLLAPADLGTPGTYDAEP